MGEVTRILGTTEGEIAQAAALLRQGRLVGMPTETVYGLAADASSADAVGRIFAAKGRPATHPVIVHVAGLEALPEWVAEVPEAARRLGEAFWPGPLTMVLRRSARVPDAVTGGQDTVAVRVPGHPVALALLRAFGGGLAAPSANRFGAVSPTRAEHVARDLDGVVAAVVDGGACEVGIESTIVDLTGPVARVLRPGAVTAEAMEAVLGEAVARAPSEAVRAPGLLPSHYKPRARVELVPAETALARATALAEQGRSVAYLGRLEAPGFTSTRAFASDEAFARGLYAAFREADDAGAEVIVVAAPEAEGLGVALLDRLRRAAR